MSDRAQRILLWIVAVVLVGGTSLALHYGRGYRPLAGFIAPSSPLPPDVALRFDRVRVVGRSKNRPAWTLTADHIETTQNHARVMFRGGVQASLLQNGKTRATMTAKGALYDTPRKLLTVDDGITCHVKDVATGRDALLINASDLAWQVDSHLVRSSGTVHAVFNGGDTIQGNQFVVDLNTHDMSLKNVHATFYVEEGSTAPPQILQGLTP